MSRLFDYPLTRALRAAASPPRGRGEKIVEGKLYVGFSGGLDSTVLLHFLWQQQLPVQAIHINHQLQSQADEWEQHCVKQCAQWQIPCTVKKVHAQKTPGQSPEAAAREARYKAFREIMTPDSILCTAHHQNDQAETLLLQLIRGAGVAGLSAMPEYLSFETSYLWRPLLSTTRAELEQYAKEHDLAWIDDPSNQKFDFDRNYLRHAIMPLLQQRWPSVSTTLARSAQHCAEAAQLLEEIAEQDYYAVIDNEQRIQISKLKKLSPARQKQVIRYWLEQNELPLPSTMQMGQIQQQLLQSREDAEPQVHWPGVTLRRYRDYLCAEFLTTNHDLSRLQLPWDLHQPLELPYQLGTLSTQIIQGKGLSPQRLAQAPLTIRFRRGGERCQPQERAHSQTLKKLFQEYAVPPWERDNIPLLYCGDEIAAVIGHWICTPYNVSQNENGLNFVQNSASL